MPHAAHISEEVIRLILGLKIKQLRTEKNISLTDLATATGISVSYLNEIEKGKKHPKPSKIAAIADAMGVPYDWLVSLQLSRHLKPIGEVLQSNLLHELPLDHFGLDLHRLVDLFATAPAKLSAFINTILEVARGYDLSVEQFYFSALRSYQEIHDNYFEELEKSVEQFCEHFGFDAERTPRPAELEIVLKEHFAVAVEREGLAGRPELGRLRSVFLPAKGKTFARLLLNPRLNDEQRAFALSRELAFQFMQMQPRPYTSSWVKIGSFDEVLNNFRASYFAGALLINRDCLVEDLQALFDQPQWQPGRFVEIMNHYRATPEMFLHRLTSILPRFFGIKQLFFLRFGHRPGAQLYSLNKELHLSGLHNPHATYLREHYCRRWASVSILHDLEQAQTMGRYGGPLLSAQRSHYIDTDREYLILALARPMMPVSALNWSVSIGLLINDAVRQKIRFLDDPQIARRMVGETCERCSALNCQERSAAPTVYQQQLAQRNLHEALRQLQAGEAYSADAFEKVG